jgi:hypothetical protein
MALGNEIILSSPPKGVFLEGTVTGTPKPGTILEVTPGQTPSGIPPLGGSTTGGGRLTYRVYQPGTDGLARPQFVLLADNLQGGVSTTAYVTGSRVRLYVPAPGEELNLICTLFGTGTGNDLAVGDGLIVHSGTGFLIPTYSVSAVYQYVVLEKTADLSAGSALVHVMRV